MPKLPAASSDQDQLRARMRHIEGSSMEELAQEQDAQAKANQSDADSLQAGSEKLRDLPDRTAEAYAASQAAHAELHAIQRHRREVRPKALRDGYSEINRHATEHREALLLHARDGIGQLQRKAAAALPMFDDLLTLTEEAATRIDRLRHVDPDNGAFLGPRAQPAADLNAVRAALGALAREGVVWPWSVDPATGAHITHRERRERDEADALRRRGYTPPSTGAAA